MEQRKENVMGTKPIRSLLPGMAFPIMLSMLVQALYNVVDSIFVAMLSENALASVNLVFPVQNLMVAVAVGTALFADPYAPVKVRDGLAEIAAQQGFAKVSELTGKVIPW